MKTHLIQSVMLALTLYPVSGFAWMEIFSTDKQAFIKKISTYHDGYTSIGCDLSDVNDSPFRKNKRVMLEAIGKSPYAVRFISPEIVADRDIALAVVQQDGLALRLLDKGYNTEFVTGIYDDEAIVLAAIRQHGYALEFASQRLQQDKAFLRKALENNFLATVYAIRKMDIDDEIKQLFLRQRSDRELVLAAVKQAGSALKYADEALKHDREIALAAVKNNDDVSMYRYVPDRLSVAYVGDTLLVDKDFMTEAVKADGGALVYARGDLRDDKALVLTAINHGLTQDNVWDWFRTVYPLIAPSLREDKEVVLALMRKNGGLIDKLEGHWQKDRDVIMAALSTNGSAYQYADEAFKYDRDIVLAMFNSRSFYSIDDEAMQSLPLSLRNDPVLMTVRLKVRGLLLQHTGYRVKQDKVAVLAALDYTGEAFQYADDSLKRDKAYVLEVLKKSGPAIRYVDKSLLTDPEVIKAAINNDGSAALLEQEPRFRNDKSLVLQMMASEHSATDMAKLFKQLDPMLQNDRDVVIAALQKNGALLELLSSEFKSDRDVVRAALSSHPSALEFADKSLRQNRDLVLETVKHAPEAFKFADDHLKQDKTIVASMFNRSASSAQFEYVHESLMDDREFVLSLHRDFDFYYSILQYLSPRLRRDKAVAVAAVEEESSALQYVDESLKNDREFILQVLSTVEMAPYHLRHVDPSLFSDKKVALAVLNMKTGSFLSDRDQKYEYIAPVLQADRDVLLTALQGRFSDHRLLISKLFPRYQADREMMLAAMPQNGLWLRHVDPALQADKAIVLAAVRENGLALRFADARWQQDEEVVQAALKNNGLALEYAAPALRQNPAWIIEAARRAPEVLKQLDADQLNPEILAFVPAYQAPAVQPVQ